MLGEPGTVFRIVVVQLVGGISVRQFGSHEPRGGAEISGQVGVQILALTLDVAGLAKGDRLGVHAEFKPRRQRHIHRERRVGKLPVLQRRVGHERVYVLVDGGAHGRTPPLSRTAHGHVGTERAHHGARGRQVLAVIVVVAAVRGPVDRADQIPAPPQPGDVAEVDQVTFRVLGIFEANPLAAIVRHVLHVELAAGAREQIAEFTAQHRAARGVDARVQGGVVIRRQVQVVRRAELEAAAAALAEDRVQEAALALVVHRKGDVRQVQERHLAHAHGGVARHAHAGGLVDRDRFGAEFPHVVAHVAGGIGGAGIAGALGVEHLALLGDAVAACVQHLIAHVMGDAVAGVGVALHVAGRQQLAGFLVAHVAAGVVIGADVVVIEAVGLQLLVGAVEFHVAGKVVDRLVGAVHVLRQHAGGAGFAQARVTAQRGVVEVEHRVGPAHRVAGRLGRAMEGAQRTCRIRPFRGGAVRLRGFRIGLMADQGECGGNGQQASWG